MTLLDRRLGVVGGLAIKTPCRVATTGPITADGLQTIDGVALATGDRVLRKDETNAVLNGIWVADTGLWERARDFNGPRDVVQGTLVYVVAGTTNADTQWVLATADPVIGTSSLSFSPVTVTDSAGVSYEPNFTGAVSRTLRSRLEERASVKDFGAIGDIATDDTIAIQKAADWWKAELLAGRHASIHFPPGGYKITDSIDWSLDAADVPNGARGEIIGGNGSEVVKIWVAYHGYGADKKAGAAFQFGPLPLDGVTAVTNANPCQITLPAHGLATGDSVHLDGFEGMTDLNDDEFVITVVDENNFTLDGTNSTGFGAWTAGGVVLRLAYQANKRISGFIFQSNKNNDGIDWRCPLGLGLTQPAQARLDHITFGSWNNTMISCDTAQNVRFNDVESYSGGKSFAYKDAAGVIVRQTGTALQATTGAPFSAADVGKTLSIWNITGTPMRRQCRVVTFTDTQNVVVDTTVTDGVDRQLFFASPYIATTAGSKTITADGVATTFTANDVGLVVWLRYGRTDVGSGSRLFRARIITYVSANVVELDIAAPLSTSATVVAYIANPAAEFYGTADDAVDVLFSRFKIENFAGVGLVLQGNGDLNFVPLKLHGEASPSVSRYSEAHLWCDRASGFIEGELASQYLGSEAIFATGATTNLFLSLGVRMANGGKLARIGAKDPGDEGAVVAFERLSLVGAAALAEPTSVITDENASTTPGYTLSLYILPENELVRRYLGANAYANSLGTLRVQPDTAVAAGGNATTRISLSSNLVSILVGSGAPTTFAPKGSLYLRTDGTTTNDRAYIATNASGGWTALTTAA